MIPGFVLRMKTANFSRALGKHFQFLRSKLYKTPSELTRVLIFTRIELSLPSHSVYYDRLAK